MDVDLWSMSKYHIDLKIKREDGVIWRLTGFYGEPTTYLRNNNWDMLKSLKNDEDLP